MENHIDKLRAKLTEILGDQPKNSRAGAFATDLLEEEENTHSISDSEEDDEVDDENGMEEEVERRQKERETFMGAMDDPKASSFASDFSRLLHTYNHDS